MLKEDAVLVALVCEGTCSPITPMYDAAVAAGLGTKAIELGRRLVHTPHRLMYEHHYECTECKTARRCGGNRPLPEFSASIGIDTTGARHG